MMSVAAAPKRETDNDFLPDILAYSRRWAEHALLRGESNEAAKSLARLVLLSPASAPALAEARHDEQEAASQRIALALGTPDAATFKARGLVEMRLGNYLEAAEQFLSAARLQSQDSEAFFRFGWCLTRLGSLDVATRIFERLKALPATTARATAGLAAIALERREHAKVAQLIDEARLADPTVTPWLPFGPLFEAHRSPTSILVDRGIALETLRLSFHVADAVRQLQRQDFEPALAELDAILDRMPDDEVALGYKVTALRGLGRSSEAIETQGELVQQLRGRLGSLEWVMILLMDGEAYEEALGTAIEILKQDPTRFTIRANAIAAAQRLADWDAVDVLSSTGMSVDRDEPLQSGLPFDLISLVEDPVFLRENAIAFAKRFQPAAAPAPIRRSPPAKGERIKLAYFSNDFHEHATMRLMAEVLELHDRRSFEVIGYCYTNEKESAFRRRSISAFDRLEEVGRLDDEAIAEKARAEGIDIFIDLKGWTKRTRTPVLNRRAAPIQVNWLGFPGTVGEPEIDYIIADPFLIPPGAEALYSEHVVRLPDTYQPNDRKREVGPPTSRSSVGLPDGAFVFASLNQHYKLTRPMFGLWMRILHAIPEAVLWLLPIKDDPKARILEEASRHGIDPHRIIFAPPLPHAQHLARYRHVDLCLDPYPCGSHTTASDALWVGSPIVTLAGQTFASRVCGSLLNAVGMPELITSDEHGYEALAINLARDRDRLAALRTRLAEARNSAPLFDAPRFTRHLEAAYRGMVERWDRPTAFDVKAE